MSSVSTFAARSSGAIAGAFLAAAIAALAPAPAIGQGLYLHAIPTEAVDVGPDARADLRLRAFVARPDELAAWIPGARTLDDHSAEIALGSYPELDPQVGDRHRRASFVIDYDEPEVRALARELVGRHGATPSAETLRRFTGEAIPTKSMDRGWDPASRVARSGAGDCTEHAVLLTALARAVGVPARVVTGIVVVEAAGGARGFGHAWSEIHHGGRWVPVDATPIGDAGETIALVPLALLDDEGPGYAVGLARQIQRRWVRRLEIHTAASPASP
jgi:hypothetical protein